MVFDYAIADTATNTESHTNRFHTHSYNLAIGVILWRMEWD